MRISIGETEVGVAPKTRRPRILIVVSTGFPQEQFDRIRDSTPDAEFIAATDDTVYELAVGIDALIGCPRHVFTGELLSRAGDTLRWVHGPGAGVALQGGRPWHVHAQVHAQRDIRVYRVRTEALGYFQIIASTEPSFNGRGGPVRR